MFNRYFTSAILAGAISGLIISLLTLYFVQPVLLHAELYETGTLSHNSIAAVDAVQDVGGIDLARDGLSIAFTMAIYIGYAFLLVGAMALSEIIAGNKVTAKQGIIWGIAGFIAVQLAPSFGLPPEVPGAAAAELSERQTWWFPTVGATIIGLWLIAFGKNLMAYLGGIVLILLPHIIGAPMPSEYFGEAPPELSAHFASRSLGVGLAAWAITGFFAAYFWQKSEED